MFIKILIDYKLRYGIIYELFYLEFSMPINPYVTCVVTNPDQYTWSPTPEDDLKKKQELSGWLIRSLLLSSTLYDKLEKILKKLDPKTQHYEVQLDRWFSVTEKFSLEIFDELGPLSQKESSWLVMKCATLIRDYTKRFNNTCLNHREVFLLTRGQTTPPKEYRKDVDILAYNLEDYKKEVNKLSYQISKAILTQCSTQSYFVTDNLDSYLKKPFSELLYFTHVSEAEAFFKSKIENFSEIKLMLGFGPAVSMSQLEPILKHFTCTHKEEITIVLHGEQYHSAKERQATSEETLKLVKKINFNQILNIVLVTDKNTQQNLSDLSTYSHQTEEGFTYSPEKNVYYLSSPSLSSTLYRNIQDGCINNELDLDDISSLLQDKGLIAPPILTHAYIFQKEADSNYRASKKWGKKALKERVNLSLTQEINQKQDVKLSQKISQKQSLNQAQALTQQQTQAQQQDVSQDMSTSTYHLYDDSYYYEDFCELLRCHAEKKLKELEDISKSNTFFTNYHLQTQKDFFEKLAKNEKIRMYFVKRIYWNNTASPIVDSLKSTMGFHSIHKTFAKTLVQNIECMADGLNPEEKMQYSYFFNTNLLNVLTYYPQFRQTDLKKPFSAPFISFPFYFPTIPYDTGDTKTENKKKYSTYLILLQEDSLSNLPVSQQLAMKDLAETLMTVFEPNRSFSIAQLNNIEVLFFKLIEFYFPGNPEYIEILKKLFKTFDEPHCDYFKILLRLRMSGQKNKMESFLKFLLFIDKRQLLKNLYLTQFKYAHTIQSVENLIDELVDALETSRINSCTGELQINSLFLNLAILTPMVDSPQNWPSFEKFAHHFLLFAAKHRMNIKYIDMDQFKNYWKRLFIKCLAYCNQNESEANALMKRLVENITTEDGFSIAPLSEWQTFFTGLEKLIDHAIDQHNLTEQLNEISELSFKWLDVPAALNQSELKIACSEMELTMEQVNPETKQFSVSLDELKESLLENRTDSPSLRRTLFRYLGCQSIREDLSFYRELLSAPGDHSLNELIVGYFILATTGAHYKSHINQEQFALDFKKFLSERHQITTMKNFPEVRVDAGLGHFFDLYNQITRDEQKGTVTLWNLYELKNFIMENRHPIPEILTQKFAFQDLVHFLLMHQDKLSEITSDVLKTECNLVHRLLKTIINERFKALNIQHEKLPYILLMKIYSGSDLKVFLNDLSKIDVFIKNYALIINGFVGSKIYGQLRTMILSEHSINSALVLTELLSVNVGLENNELKLNLSGEFLSTVNKHPILLKKISQAKSLLAQIIALHFNTTLKPEILEHLLIHCEQLLKLDSECAEKTLRVILGHINSAEGYELFCSQKLTLQQIQDVTRLLDVEKVPVSFIQLCLKDNPDCHFNEIANVLKDTQVEERKNILSIFVFMATAHPHPLTLLQQLKKIPIKTLEQLNMFVELQFIKATDLAILLESQTTTTAVNQYERDIFAQHKERYQYDIKRITEKIALIKQKTGDEDKPLDPLMQEKLKQDYVTLMSYMTERPVLIEEDEQGNKTNFAIHNLSRTQFQTVFDHLRKLIHDKHISKKTKHAYSLIVLGLCCEGIYRTTKKFPRDTQLISILNDLNQDDSLIQEIKTGEGKSMTSAIQAILLVANGKTADIATENNQLASDNLNKFRRFYHYLGVACGEKPLEPNSAYREYIENGINCSTPGSFALFRAQMQLAGKVLPNNSALICDEVDATLTTTVLFRLAATLNPLLLDTESWSIVYKTMLDFIKEKELFLENQCSQESDIYNFRNYFLLKNPTKELKQFIDSIPSTLLGTLIESAMTSEALEEGVDYVILTKNGHPYAAPILESTKRPDAKVSYSEGVQQLLHAQLNKSIKDSQHAFEIEAGSETLLAISAKNFFDYYRLNGGGLIGFTGTGGSNVEVKEFKKENALTVYSYPTFHSESCEDLGLIAADGPEQQLIALEKLLRGNQQTNPGQPVLIITEDPKTTLRVNNFLSTHIEGNIQDYLGYEQLGRSEESVLEKAGAPHSNTVATQSLARGADINPKHDDGLFVINYCTNLTESDLRQIRGRAARNGKVGKFCSVIDASRLEPEASPEQSMEDQFKAHQQKISRSQQITRLKTRLLEEVRHFVIDQYFFGVKEKADKILSRQFGKHFSYINSQNFLNKIHDFNENAERQYLRLLGNKEKLDDAEIDDFIEGIIFNYQRTLEQWFPENSFEEFQAVEPLIPLEHLKSLSALNALTKDDLLLLSQPLTTGWEYFGNKDMQKNLNLIDQLLSSFEPYFNGQCGLNTATAELLKKQKILNIDQAILAVENIETTLINYTDSFSNIHAIGPFIPVSLIKKSITDYFALTKQQIKSEKWDEIDLPKMNTEAITLWYGRLNSLINVVNYGSILAGGPIPFIVNQIVLPTLFSSIKSFFKKIFSYSESTYVQLLMAMDELTSDASNALIAIFSLTHVKETTVGEFLDKFSPLLNNKAFILLITKVLEQQGKKDLEKKLPLLPLFLFALEPYRNLKIQELFNPEKLMGLLLQLNQLEIVRNKIDNAEFQKIMTEVSRFKLNVTPMCDDVSIHDAFELIQCMAHPSFFEFLKALPKKSSLQDIITWLHADFNLVPLKAQEPLKKLRDYQSNHESVQQGIEIIPKLKMFRELSIPDFVSLMKVMGHPIFCEFLKSLPKKTTLSDINSWLDADLNLVPLEVQEPLKKLRDYQSNHERVEADVKSSLIALRENFKLSKANIHGHLAYLTRESNKSTQLNIERTSFFSWNAFFYAVQATAIVAANIYFFTIPVLLTSLLLSSLLIYRESVSRQRVLLAQERAKQECLNPISVEPIHVSVIQQKTNISENTHHNKEERPQKLPEPLIPSVSQNSNALFNQAPLNITSLSNRDNKANLTKPMFPLFNFFRTEIRNLPIPTFYFL